MDDKGILIMLSSSFGTVYRSVFTADLNTVKKFIVSIILSIIVAFIIIAYCKENEVKHYYIVLISLLAGLLIHPVAQIIIEVGARSQKTIADSASKYIEEKAQSFLSQNKKEEKTDGTNGTDNQIN